METALVQFGYVVWIFTTNKGCRKVTSLWNTRLHGLPYLENHVANHKITKNDLSNSPNLVSLIFVYVTP